MPAGEKPGLDDDFTRMPDADTFELLPWRNDDPVARIFCNITQLDGSPFLGDPRQVLRRGLDRAKALGYRFYASSDLEYFYFADAEAALVNLSENIQREDPRPIQLAHAVRALTEDYGLTMKQVAGRLKRSEAWLSNLLSLVMLPASIQESVANGKTPVSAAIELTKLPTDKQVQTFNDLAASEKGH